MGSASTNPAVTRMKASNADRDDRIIQEALEILDRRLFTREPSLKSPDAVGSYLKLKLAAEEHEVFAAVFLDAQLQPLAFEVLFTGTVDGATVYPRQLVKRAMKHNAAAVVISHNHPSGCSNPSSADLQLTRRIREALKLVDVRLVDHIVIGKGKPVSLAEEGLI